MANFNVTIKLTNNNGLTMITGNTYNDVNLSKVLTMIAKFRSACVQAHYTGTIVLQQVQGTFFREYTI